jgi:hypothetical protein
MDARGEDYKNVLEVLAFLDLPACLNAGDIGEHHIKQDQIGTMDAGFLEAFLPRRCLQDFMPRSPEGHGGQDEEFGVIFSNKYFDIITYS